MTFIHLSICTPMLVLWAVLENGKLIRHHDTLVPLFHFACIFNAHLVATSFTPIRRKPQFVMALPNLEWAFTTISALGGGLSAAKETA
jgi:hypothetical protein